MFPWRPAIPSFPTPFPLSQSRVRRDPRTRTASQPPGGRTGTPPSRPRLDEVSRLCEADVPPAVFYGEMLKRLLESLAAPAGAVWTRTPQGNLQLQFQVNLKEIGLDQSDEVAPEPRRIAAPGRRAGQADAPAAAQRRRPGRGRQAARRQPHRFPPADRADPAQRSGRRPDRSLAAAQPAGRRRARLPAVHDPDGRAGRRATSAPRCSAR